MKNVSFRPAAARAFFSWQFFFLALSFCAKAQSPSSGKTREYIVVKVYHASDSSQLATIDQYLQNSFLPTLTKSGFSRIGAFSAVDIDTAKDKRMYVVVPLSALTQLEKLNAATEQALADSSRSRTYISAAYNQPPYNRMETIVLRTFEGAPQVKASGTKGSWKDKVYELRSYESATEALHANKVRMFNSGEIDLFQRLGFNAVFYGQVIAGSQMPNLMYITSFDNKAARDEHWKSFGSDPQWKEMSAKPEFQHNVSKNTSIFLHPRPYSNL